MTEETCSMVTRNGNITGKEEIVAVLVVGSVGGILLGVPKIECLHHLTLIDTCSRERVTCCYKICSIPFTLIHLHSHRGQLMQY